MSIFVYRIPNLPTMNELYHDKIEVYFTTLSLIFYISLTPYYPFYQIDEKKKKQNLISRGRS